MTRLKICYYVPMRHKIFLSAAGDFMNQLRLALLTTEVCLPFGLKQGSFQLTHWKSPEVTQQNRCQSFFFQKSAVGGMTVMPLQVEFGLQSSTFYDLQLAHDLSAHPLCQELTSRFDASNFIICYTRNGSSELKVLTFDSPIACKPHFPTRMHLQNDFVQITHRGGMPKVHQPNGIPVYSESNREH